MSNTTSPATIITPQKRRGRKPVNHRCSWDNREIDGLYRKPGTNVWRVRQTGQEFTEPIERRAVERFLTLTQGTRPTVAIPAPPPGPAPVPQQVDAFDLTFRRPAADQQATQPGTRIVLDDAGNLVFTRDVDEAGFYAAMAKIILTQKERAARMTGVEQLAWLADLQRPEKGASLEALGQTYYDHCDLSPNELSRSKCFWSEFVKTAKGMNIRNVDEVTFDLARKYEAAIMGKKLAPKSRLHRYRKVRGILHFNIRRGNSVEHCRAALDKLAMLEVKDAHPLDPTPISPRDFWAIHREAVKAGDTTFAALLLFALNTCSYAGEVAAARWDEIDFATRGFVSRRPKTKVSRIAVLWPDVAKAIKALPRMREQIFCTKVRSYTVFSVGDKFEKYRNAAGIDKAVTFSWIRDAAYSTALQATTFDKAELLAGHRLAGTADAYLRRNPQLVAEACEAVRSTFYRARPKSR